MLALFFSPDLSEQEPNPPYKLPVLVDFGGDLKKRWHVEFWLWSKKELRFKRIRVSKRINDHASQKGRREEAKVIIEYIIQELRSGKKYYDDKQTVDRPSTIAEAITAYQSHIGNSVDEATFRYYGALNKHISDVGLAKTAITRFSEAEALDLQLYLRHKELASKTINNYLKNLSTVLSFCVRKKWIKENPMANFNYGNVQIGEANLPYSKEQLATIRELGKEKRHYLLFVSFMLYTLARPEDEICNIQVKHLLPKMIYFPATNVKGNNKKYVEIVPPLERIIEAEGLRKLNPEYYIFGYRRKGNTYIYQPGPHKMDYDAIYRTNVAFLKEMGLYGKGYGVYSFKPTGAIFMLLAGVPLTLISRLMGHANVEITMRYFRNMGHILRSDPSLEAVPDFEI